MSRARIGVLYAHRLDTGGVETQLAALMRHSDPERFCWTVFADASPDFAERARACGAQLLPWAPRRTVDPGALRRLLELLRRHPVDLLHLHSPRAALYGRLAARRVRVPAVVTVHMPAGHPVGGTGVATAVKHRLYAVAERLLLGRFPGRIIHVSARAREEGRARGAAPDDRTVVIENGVALESDAGGETAAELRARLQTPTEATVLACVARLDRQKGLETLLDALHRLGPEADTLQAWLVGDGPLRRHLESRTAELGLEERVRFLGTRHDVARLLRAADLFVLPSRHETTSFALLEAMAAGLAIVATDVGDSARLLGDGACGRIVPPGEPAALADGLAELLKRRELRERLASAARERARLYSDVGMAERTQEIYRHALGSTRPH